MYYSRSAQPKQPGPAETREAIDGINLEFPATGGPYPHVSFAADDLHEDYLAWFDAHGVSIFLQVEPGLADVPTLIDLVLDRYGDH
ncbi:MAG: hypothetical protein QHJ73_12350, partial [Armatimonadota bacterium]|nr:hypothetical protein [Armatimonadota bacterium]